ncbi:MAG: NAD(P)H-hydrate dehydratase [Desulfobacteraceae bacterium]|jgi:NAD(P)H-hydrate epimerase|nr:MAG: NAD(P)H-hydrate dehydratase [Desulfobacteraceae bacterium]
MRICTVSEIRDMDRAAIEHFGIPEEILMENAGIAVCTAIDKELGISGRSFLVFCGAGNNGGDGLVIARKLFSLGAAVKIFLMGTGEKYKGAARLNLSIARRLPIEIIELSDPSSLNGELERCDAVVDALFGTGLDRDISGNYAQTIELINKSGKTVFSVDTPSGVNGDTGGILGAAVKADYTVTFGLPKLGNVLYPGSLFCGRLLVTHISFPPALHASEAIKIQTNDPLPLPERDPAGHKGSFGDVLFIAGASGYYGAPSLAALSFLKAGGGYSRLAAPCSIVPYLANTAAEVVFVPQKETPAGALSFENRQGLLEMGNSADMVVMGPGVSLAKETQDLIRYLSSEIRRPLLIDGDGLTAVSSDPDIIGARNDPTIMTPHPGEMSRLTGLSIKDIKDNPINIVREMCKRLKATIVLKGARSIIGHPDGTAYLNLSGNSGMATAGSGDVLTGAIAAMYGLGLPVEQAARNGVFAHGIAGDLAAAEKGPDGIVARDILEKLPIALQHMRKGTWRALGRYEIEIIL